MKSHHIGLFCIVSIIIIPLLVIPSLIDDGLLPRFIVLSVFLMLFSIYFFRKLSIELWHRINLIDYLFIAFFGIHLLSITWAINSAEAIFSTMKIGLFVLLYFLFKWLLNSYKEQALTTITWCICILSLILGIFALYQLYQVSLEVGFDRFTVSPVTGLSGNKNILSGTLYTLLPFLFLGVYRSNKKTRWIFILSIVILIYLIWQLRTRSILFAGVIFALATVMYYLYGSLKYKLLKTVLIVTPFIAIGVFITIFFLGYTSEVSEFLHLKEGTKTGTLAERFTIWEKSIQLYKQHPIIGVGSGNWKIAFPEVGFEGLQRAEQTTTFFARPHNDWIQILCETGIIGGLIWISLWITTLWKNSILLGKSKIKKEIIQRSLILSGSIGFAVFAMVSYPLERIEFIILLAIYFAFLNHQSVTKNDSSVPKAHPILLRSIIILLGIVSVYGLYRMQQEYDINTTKDRITKGKQAFTSDNYQSYIYSITPTGTPVKYYEGLSLLQKQHYNKAIIAFQESLDVAPYDLPTHLNIGVSYFRNGDTNRALHHYKEALRISPKHQDVLFNTAALYYKLKDKQKTLEFLNQVTDSYPRKKEFLEAVSRLENITKTK